MGGDEGRALGGRDFRMFQAILPLVHRPSVEIIFGQLREDLVEIDLPVAKRPIARRALQPRLIAGKEALLACWTELGVLHVKSLDALVVEVDERDVVEPLLDEVAGVIVDVAAAMIADRGKELFERLPVENVLAGMQLKSNVDALFVEGVEDRLPAPRKLVERRLDEMAGALRPRIDIGPRERTTERLRDLEPKAP